MSLWQEWEAIYTAIDRSDAQVMGRAYYELHRDEMDTGAKVLWPELEDLYTLMCMRVEGGPDRAWHSRRICVLQAADATATGCLG